MHKNHVLHDPLACGEELETQKTSEAPQLRSVQGFYKHDSKYKTRLVVLELNVHVPALMVMKW